MTFTHWFRISQETRSGRKSVRTHLHVEALEARALLASPVSLTPIVNSPILNPVNGLTSSLLNPVTNLLNPVTNLLNPVTSLVNPLLGSIINPFSGSPLPVSLVSPLVGSIINTLPQALPTVTLGSVTGLPSAIPLPAALGLNPGNLFQPKPTPNESHVPSGSSGFGGTQYNPSSPSVVYYSAPSRQPTYSGGLGEVLTVAPLEIDSSSSAVGPTRGNDALVVVGLGDDEEATMAGAGLQEVMLAFDDDLNMPNLAATLLTGVRPRASLLPQRDSQVAPVATLLSDDASDMSGITLDEYRPRLDGHPDDLLINPAASQGSGIRSQESGLEISSGEDKSASIPAEKSGVRNQESGVKITAQAAGKSAISDLLMFGFVTAMMAFKAFRARRLGDPDDPGRPDSRKIEQPSLGARNPKS